MLKRLFLFIVVFTLAIAPFTANAAEDSGTYKGITWNLDKQGNLSFEGGGEIPAEGPWVAYAKDIKNIVIGDSISFIRSNAFKDLKNLKSVTLGKDVTVLEEGSFSGCKNLKSVTLTGEKTQLKGESFYASAFTELNLPDNSYYTISNNCVLTADGKTMVYYLDGKNADIPDGVTEIQSGAFWCNNTAVNVSLPKTITSLGSCAFGNADKLESIVIPSSVTSLSGAVFWDCIKMKSLVFQGDTISIQGTHTFGYCSNLQSVVMPIIDFVTIEHEITGSTFSGCWGLQTVVLSEGTKEIPDKCFNDCNKIKNVYIPASVNKINDSAFSHEMKNLVIKCIEGSYAETYAKEAGYKYEYYTQTESLTLPETEIVLKKGKTSSLKPTVEPAKVTIKDLMWYSTDDNVATVTKGKIQAKGNGECDIICKAMDGSGAKVTCHVIVQE